MKWHQRILLTSLVGAAIAAQPVWPAAAADAPAAAAAPTANAVQAETSPFAKVKGLDSEGRSLVYEALKLSPAGWELGQVLSKDPYVVVTKADAEGATVRVWTGVLRRDADGLRVFWDELRFEKSGRLEYRATDELAGVPGYFDSESQAQYRTKAYLGIVPWADIPTDAEAASSGRGAVPSDGALNVYGIAYKEEQPVLSSTLGPVKTLTQDIPSKVPTLRAFKEKAVTDLPIDAAQHWAKEEILDLMRKSIIEGYEDQTIRPDRTLSKAEFVTLLVKSLSLPTAKAGVSGYADLIQHWSAPYVAAAQAAGVLDRNPSQLNFAPDAAMTRMEMAELASRILTLYGVNPTGETVAFQDSASMSASGKSALQQVVSAGIVGGYPDGTFRPQGSLTRAEAFKVISKIIQLV